MLLLLISLNFVLILNVFCCYLTMIYKFKRHIKIYKILFNDALEESNLTAMLAHPGPAIFILVHGLNHNSPTKGKRL